MHFLENYNESCEERIANLEKNNQNLKIQQKEFIKYLADEINKLVKEYVNYVYEDYSEEKGKYDTYIEILQRYKEIIEDKVGEKI